MVTVLVICLMITPWHEQLSLISVEINLIALDYCLWPPSSGPKAGDGVSDQNSALTLEGGPGNA